MDALQQAFVTEAKDVLEALEEALLALDEDPEDKARIDGAFRALHTLKGSGAMVGFSELERFAHQLESAFDAVRSGQRSLDPALISTALSSIDHLGALVDAGPEACDALRSASDQLLQQLAGGAAPPAAASAAAPRAAIRGEVWGESAWLVTVAPEPELFLDGMDPLEQLRGLETLGKLAFVGLDPQPPPLEELVPGHVHLSWRAVVVGEIDGAEIDRALFFLQDRAVCSVEKLGEDAFAQAMDERPAEIVAALLDPTPDRLKSILFGTPTHEKPPERPTASAAPTEKRTTPPAGAKEEMVKVSVSKLDVLVDLVGEMVIAQARLAEIARRHEDDPELESVAEDLERMCTAMRDSTMDLRMLPIGTTFSRFKRLVRDISNQLGKRIQLVTEGEETELDKTVIDKLGDPMVHLIRNSLDHGIETPEERLAAGKPESGTIWLSARHSETNVVIEVRDDGKGLDSERIRAKAIERGLIDASDRLEEEQIQDLIFHPGFSTAQSVSALSGRGVGMDAVRTAVRALRGEIGIRSTLGEGTTIRIQLPLTLAIIEGLLVELDTSRFVLPLGQVEECIEVPRPSQGTRRFTELRGELVPYFSLREWFGSDTADLEQPQVVVTNVDGRRFGFIVDNVVGQQQTVIKSLGQAYRGLDGISGATILGDGEVALILDPPKIAASLFGPVERAA